MDMARIKDWLDAIPSPYTRKTYKAGIKKFEEFYGKGIETLIGKSGEETGRIIEKFYVWLKEKGHGQNTCRNSERFCKNSQMLLMRVCVCSWRGLMTEVLRNGIN